MYRELIDAVKDRVTELQEFQYFVIGARHLLVDLAGKTLQARVQGNFQSRKAGVVTLRHLQPVNIDAHVVEELAYLETVVLRTYGHHLVKRRLDLYTAADKARGDAAGQVVALEHEHIQPLIGQHERGGEARQGPSDHDHVIMIFVKFHNRLSPVMSFTVKESPQVRLGQIRRISPPARGSTRRSRPCRRSS